MIPDPTWTPHSCPRCGEHRLVVTRVRCAGCGLELAADDLGSYCPHHDPTSREPGADGPAATGPAAGIGSQHVVDDTIDDPARAQILARVASGELAPAVAAQLLASLRSRPA